VKMEWMTVKDPLVCGAYRNAVFKHCARLAKSREQQGSAEYGLIPKSTSKPIDGRTKVAKGANRTNKEQD
jgi:hypothetical protein